MEGGFPWVGIVATRSARTDPCHGHWDTSSQGAARWGRGVFLSLALRSARIASFFWPQLSGLSSSACARSHASSTLIALAGPGVAPSSPLSISDTGPQITALPQINARWSANSMLSCQSLNPNICGRASRSGWMGEAKRRSVGDRKRAQSPTEGHNTLFFCSSCYCCDPYIQHPKIPNEDTYQQSAQGGSLHTPTTGHSTQLITALP